MRVPLLDLKLQYAPLKAEILAAIEQVADSQQLVLGPQVDALETSIELYTGNLIFSVGETIRGNTAMASAKITNINYPNVKHNTGKVLYVENRKKITRTYDQAENIHIVIEF
jgi:hypothetical protein